MTETVSRGVSPGWRTLRIAHTVGNYSPRRILLRGLERATTWTLTF